MTQPDDTNSTLDDALRRRLARLDATPVDTTRLERRIREAMNETESARTFRVFRRFGVVSGLAAAMALVAVIVWILLDGGAAPVIASPAELARVHQELVDGTARAEVVAGIEDARRVARAEWADAPRLPEPTVGKIASCCVHGIQDRKVACVALDYKGHKITVAVSHQRDLMCSHKHEEVRRNGRLYFLHDDDEVRMAMIEERGLWVCVMGDAPLDVLMEVADGLRF